MLSWRWVASAANALLWLGKCRCVPFQRMPSSANAAARSTVVALLPFLAFLCMLRCLGCARRSFLESCWHWQGRWTPPPSPLTPPQPAAPPSPAAMAATTSQAQPAVAPGPAVAAAHRAASRRLARPLVCGLAAAVSALVAATAAAAAAVPGSLRCIFWWITWWMRAWMSSVRHSSRCGGCWPRQRVRRRCCTRGHPCGRTWRHSSTSPRRAPAFRGPWEMPAMVQLAAPPGWTAASCGGVTGHMLPGCATWPMPCCPRWGA